MCSKIRKIVQLSGVKRAIIRCFYIAKNDLVAVTQKSVQLSGSCNYPACYYPETTVLIILCRGLNLVQVKSYKTISIRIIKGHAMDDEPIIKSNSLCLFSTSVFVLQTLKGN